MKNIKILNCLKYKNVKFDFDNNTIEFNGKIKRVVEDTTREYTYKIQKTQIKATNGIKGLYEFMEETANDKEHFWYSCFAQICDNI